MELEQFPIKACYRRIICCSCGLSALSQKNTRTPDFVHKIALEALWMDSFLNPPWVKDKIATMAFDQVQSRSRSTPRVPISSGYYDQIQKLSEEGRLKEALHLLGLMVYQSSVPPKDAFVCLLRGCSRKKALAEGKLVHALIVQANFDTSIFLSNLLIEMYSTCGSVAEALKVFAAMPRCNVFSWTVMISAYVNCGQYREALDLFQYMQQSGTKPEKATYVVLLKACGRTASLKQGQRLHRLITKRGFDSDVIVQTSLIDMYEKCGCLEDARKLFDNMPQRDVISWNTMIAGYAQKGLGKEALDLYEQMKFEGLELNNITLVLLLKACASISALERGKELHSLILEKGCESQKIIQTALLDMYAKCGCVKDAREVFNSMHQRDVVSWNAMIAAYAQKGFGKEALDVYEQMKHEGMEPDNVTLVLLLKACASISALESGKELHLLILEKGCESDMMIQNTLLDMYAKCGCLNDARELFDNMPQRNVISWTAMIAGYVQKGLGKEALDLYEQMKYEGVEPNSITVVLLLKACASFSALEQGKELHSLILEKGFESETSVRTTLLDMYAKCGCLKDARALFNNMLHRNVVSWSAMIAGYAQEGLGKEALDLYQQMKHEGLQANEVTYTCVLSACSHSGLVDEALHVFESMVKDDGVTPTLEHYSCMVDLLGRAGLLEDAEDFILKMPTVACEAVWLSLMGAARKYLNVEIGRRAFGRILELKPEGNAAPFLLLIDIYLAAGRMDEVAQLKEQIKHKGLEKVLGCSWIEVDSQVPSLVGNSCHLPSK